MKKRIFAIILSVMMMIMIVPTVLAAGDDAVAVTITPDKQSANPGDIVTFTVSINVPTSIYTLQFELGEMTGLELTDRGSAAEGIKETLGFDNFAWADDTSLTVNGYGATPNVIEGDVVLGSFQCKVLDTEGEVSAELYNIEFTDENYEALEYTVESIAVKVTNDSDDSSNPEPVESSETSVESSSVADVESSETDSSAAEASSTSASTTTSSKAAASSTTQNPSTGSAAPIAMAAVALIGAAAIVVKQKKD